MSDNLTIVQEMFAAFGRGDVATLVDHVAPDVTWQTMGDPAHGGHYGARTGKAGVVDFFTRLGAENDYQDFVPETFDATGDKVFVTGRASLVKRASGKPVEDRWIMAFAFKDGKVVDWREWDHSAAHLLAR